MYRSKFIFEMVVKVKREKLMYTFHKEDIDINNLDSNLHRACRKKNTTNKHTNERKNFSQ
jgi:hypothetical protein